jgi:hypothetical protein
MMGAGAVAVTLGTMATIAVADDGAALRDASNLLDQGYVIVAEGRLQDLPQCSRYTLRVLPKQPADSCEPRYGSFKRLKGSDGEFVCVSFRNWACYPSQNPN